MRRRFLATWLLLAGVVGCGPVTSPPTIPSPEPSASPMEPSPAPSQPQPTPSATTQPDTTRIEFLANRQARFPDIQSFDFTTKVGMPYDLTAIASRPGLVWSLESDTPGLAEMATTVADDGKTTSARLEFRQPGMIRVRATLGKRDAYFDVVGIDAATVSAPSLNPVPPTVIFDRIRVLTTPEDWQAFWTASLRKETGRSQETAPAVDFSKRSVVVIGAWAMDRILGPATVTHTSGTDIHVAFPHMSEYMVLGHAAPIPQTVVQEIPKMPPDARFIFSGEPSAMFPPPDNEVVGLRPHDIPDPNPSLW